MHVATDRLQFAPPPQPGMVRALVLAVIAHLLLLAALTWGVNWKNEAETISAEAELWSSVPQQAAPRQVETPPPPAPAPAPVPIPKVTPPPKPEPVPNQADIALEREQKKKAEVREKQLALEREKKIEAQKKLAQDRAQKLEEQKQLEAAKKKAAEDKQKQDAAKARQLEDAKKLEAQRQENLKRIQGLAGANGPPSSTGAALRSSGPSSSYAGRIRARVKPNIVFTEDIEGNPMADVEVRTAPDGTIVGQRILKSSGVRAWDDAVLKAVMKTEVLPRDVDGRVHSPLIIGFRPKD